MRDEQLLWAAAAVADQYGADGDAVAAELRALAERADQNERLAREIDHWLERTPCAIRVCEGGGPENLAMSFAVTLAKIDAERASPDAQHCAQGVPVGYRFRVLPIERRSITTDKNCAVCPWVAEWDKDTPPDNDLIQYQTIYAARSAQGVG